MIYIFKLQQNAFAVCAYVMNETYRASINDTLLIAKRVNGHHILRQNRINIHAGDTASNSFMYCPGTLIIHTHGVGWLAY